MSVLYPEPGHVGDMEIRPKSEKALKVMSTVHRAAWVEAMEEAKEDILS
ncbi:hypothetical protein [Streptomyces sp. NPDC048637]